MNEATKKRLGRPVAIANLEIKEKILTAIRERPRDSAELRLMFKVDTKTMSAMLTSLKKYHLIETDNKEVARNFRKWVATKRLDTYEQCAVDGRKKYLQEWKPASQRIEFSPHAIMRVTCDHYHTRGNKQRASAWAGYEAMGGVA